MKINHYFLFGILFISTWSCLYANTIEPFTLNTALKHALKSKHAQQLTLNSDISTLDMDIYFSIYDIQTTHTLSLTNDKTKKSSPYFPQSTQQTAHTSLEKQFPSGTRISGTTTLSNSKYTYPSNTALNNSFSTSSLEIVITHAVYGSGTKQMHANLLQKQHNTHKQELLMVLDKTEDLIFNTTMDYWTLVQTKLTVDTYQNDLKTAKELLTINQSKAKSGLIEDRTIFALKASNIEKEQALSRVQSQYEDLLETFSVQLAIPADHIHISTNTDTIEKMISTLPIPTTLSTENSVSKNRLIQHAQLQIQSKQINYLTQIDSEKPDIEVYSKYTRNNLDDTLSSSLGGIISENNYLLEAGVSIEMPLLSTTKFAKTKKAAKHYKISEYELDLLKDHVTISERKISNQIQHLKHEMTLSKESLFWRQKKYQKDDQFFKSGRLDIDDLLKSKAELTYAEINYTKAVVNYAKAITQWYRVHNRLLDHVHTSIMSTQETSL